MLQRIEIRNFQSHKATNIDLSDKVNVIQGNSDCGKSAIMRALYWLIFNPAGDYFISDWARPPGGKTIKAPCEVTINIDGHVITRRRDKDFNGYILDDQVFEATRNSVPPQVAAVLGLGEVNVQRQLDSPFLLSMSAGDVSRYINSLVDLSRIDTWMTSVKSKSQSLSKDVERYTDAVAARQAEVDSYDWLPGLESLSATLVDIENRSKKLGSEMDVANDSMSRYEELRSALASLPDLENVYALLGCIDSNVKKSSAIEAEYAPLAQSVDEHGRICSRLASMPDIDRFFHVARDIEDLSGRKFLLGKSGAALEADVNAYEARKSQVDSLPDVDRLVDIVGQLGRMESVRKNMSEMKSSMGKQLERYGELETEYVYAMQNEQAARAELSTMTCPMCGRSGVHEHG